MKCDFADGCGCYANGKFKILTVALFGFPGIIPRKHPRGHMVVANKDLNRSHMAARNPSAGDFARDLRQSVCMCMMPDQALLTSEDDNVTCTLRMASRATASCSLKEYYLSIA